VVGLCLPVRALARRTSDGSGLDRTDTRPVELVGRMRGAWEEGGELGGAGCKGGDGLWGGVLAGEVAVGVGGGEGSLEEEVGIG
jgi:hypothetical protein